MSWCLADSTSFAAELLHILVMAPTTAAKGPPKYEALSEYLKSVDPLLGDIKVRVAEGYPDAALEAVAGGVADYAMVKSTVFVPESYPGLALVGSDVPGNPDNTFIMPRESYEKLGALISKALLGLGPDTSEKAKSVKGAFGCAGFVVTTGMDFAPTFSVIRKTGIDLKTFDFEF